MKIYKTTALMLGILALFTACATPPKSLAPHPFTQNISAVSCEKLSARLDKLMADNDSFYPVQKKLAKKDRGLVTGAIIGGMFIFPLAFIAIGVKGDGPAALAIQKNKGEIDAIKRELSSGRCA
ncbi:hypothetical protein COTS27_00211 [Spirochaetota bacterium]|nr:hypothetical protein COTS27_00211 [Spirochaetota bacterium]